MNEAVLCVDDEPSMLIAFPRFLEGFQVETADSGEAALAALAIARSVRRDLVRPADAGDGRDPFVGCRAAQYPDTVRLLLTGNANLESAIQAVNDGHIFRFLSKPCSVSSLRKAVGAAVEQYRLVTAQKDLLENTLRAVVHVLGEVLAVVSPVAFGRAARVRHLVRDLTEAAGSLRTGPSTLPRSSPNWAASPSRRLS